MINQFSFIKIIVKEICIRITYEKILKHMQIVKKQPCKCHCDLSIFRFQLLIIKEKNKKFSS